MEIKDRISERFLLVLAAGLTCAAMLLMLGKAPLYLEEPRRAIIAMEMAWSGNYWTPTLFGDWYYNKPPVFTWVLLAFSWLGRQFGAGSFDVFWLRLPSVFSAGAIAWLLYRAGKQEVHARFGARAGMFFLSFGSILLFFSMLAEIDLLYALLVFSSILVIWRLGEQEAYLQMFLATYLLCGLGVLTKGLPSLAFTGISLLVYFGDKKRIGMLFSFAHAAGILLLMAILGGFFLKYAQNHPIENLLFTLAGESGRRTAVGGSLFELPRHLLLYPLNLLVDMFPGSLVGLLLLRRDIRSVLLGRHPFIRFCTLMLLANFLLYWVSPGARVRYMYPLFPFAALLFAWAYELRAEAPVWANVWVKRILAGIIFLPAGGILILLFFPDIRSIPYVPLIVALGFPVFAWIWWLSRSKTALSLSFLFVVMALGRLVFDFTVLPHRALYSGAKLDQDLALTIHQATEGRPLYLYGEEKVLSYTTCYYLGQYRQQPLVLQDQLQKNQFFLLPSTLVGPKDSVLLRTMYGGEEKALILKRY